MPQSLASDPAIAPDVALRVDLAAALRLAVRFDLHEGIDNHFTVRVDAHRFLVNRYGLHWSEITASNLSLVDGRTGHVVGGGEAERVAYHIHWPVYRSRPDVRCVLHTHMPYATALCLIDRGRLEMADQVALRFHGRIAYDDEYPGPVGTQGEAEGDRLARTLGDKPILFMRSHGVLVAAASVAHAFDDLYYLERCARKQWLAAHYGRPLAAIAPEVADAAGDWFGTSFDVYKETHFAALRRVLDRDEPDYRQ
ncbi:MAG: class II aldolase/adducin family protein [Alphaproteobacteria bacterium]